MIRFQDILKYIVTSLVLGLSLPMAGSAQVYNDDLQLSELFDELAQAGPQEAAAIEDEIARELARSGSDAMDLLLERGEAALEAQDFEAAINHFTALVDHAPDFPEAYNGRATAYYLTGLYGPAMKDIAQVLTLEPRHFAAMSGLALILEETGDSEGALKVLHEIAEIHPHMDGLSDRIARLELALQGTAI